MRRSDYLAALMRQRPEWLHGSTRRSNRQRSKTMVVRFDLDKLVAWLMTLVAVFQFAAWLAGDSGIAAYFAGTAAWFAWIVVVRRV